MADVERFKLISECVYGQKSVRFVEVEVSGGSTELLVFVFRSFRCCKVILRPTSPD